MNQLKHINNRYIGARIQAAQLEGLTLPDPLLAGSGHIPAFQVFDAYVTYSSWGRYRAVTGAAISIVVEHNLYGLILFVNGLPRLGLFCRHDESRGQYDQCWSRGIFQEPLRAPCHIEESNGFHSCGKFWQ